jgi:hypothetical protein
VQEQQAAPLVQTLVVVVMAVLVSLTAAVVVAVALGA